MGLLSKRGTSQSGIWKVTCLSEEKEEAAGHASCLWGPAHQMRQLSYDTTVMGSVQQHNAHLLESPGKVCPSLADQKLRRVLES